MLNRAYLDYTQFSCRYNGGGKSITVQDFNTTVKRVVERAANGVVNPESLKLNGMSYGDVGLPASLDYFDRLELLRDTNVKIDNLTKMLNEPEETPPVSVEEETED